MINRAFYTDHESAVMHSLDYFLLAVCGKLQISKTQFEDAVSKYEAIANWLKGAGPDSILYHCDIRVVPHGSLASHTTVKPKKKDEFDLDAFIEVTSDRQFSPMELQLAVYLRLEEHEYYKTIIALKSRCIRINYAGQFHFDLMPAIPNGDRGLWVPEKDEDGIFSWQPSNPEGLLTFFENQAALQQVFKNDLSERAFEVVPIPEMEEQLTALHHTIQLLKRARDTYFDGDPRGKKAIKSVVILTQLSLNYGGSRNIASTLLNSVSSLEHLITNPKVTNPVNEAEEFTKKWDEDPTLFEDFCKWIRYTKRGVEKLVNGNSFPERISALKLLFGESLSQEIVETYGDQMQKNQKKKLIGTSQRGSLILGASPASVTTIKRHQFYGHKKK